MSDDSKMKYDKSTVLPLFYILKSSRDFYIDVLKHKKSFSLKKLGNRDESHNHLLILSFYISSRTRSDVSLSSFFNYFFYLSLSDSSLSDSQSLLTPLSSLF